ncbi:hypothetical protein BGX21_007622 [Mortierella sp. AD011]|nr:hypothetical protein BGX20_000774 [Mortierella sp. AD010]KAF9403013.1 hypothetical protein BGX21_007622 [Mortierella sp. AD011]
MLRDIPYTDNNTHRLHSSIASRSLVFSFLVFELILAFVSAEAPTPVSKMAYATVDESTLYVQMGILPGGTMSTNAFYSLDLQSNWNAANPPWKNLVSSSATQQAPSGFGPSMTVSANNQNLIIWGGFFSNISTYDIETGSWSVNTQSPANSSPQMGLKAVTDSSSGLVYIPSGANQGNNMMEYNPTTGASRSLPMPSEFAGYGLAYYSVVWSTQRNSILLYGGHLITANYSANEQLFEYKPSTSTWSLVNTTGQSPGNVENHCAVAANGGAKMVVFGGQNPATTQLGGIYILDIPSLTWVEGADIGQALSRSNMACTVSGDNFVAWGGDRFGEISEAMGTPVIYNLKSNQWTTQYSLSGADVVPAGSSNKTKVGAAIGASIGALVMLALIGYFVFRRTQRSMDSQKDIESSSATNVGGYSEKTPPINTDIKEGFVSDTKVPIDVAPDSTAPRSQHPTDGKEANKQSNLGTSSPRRLSTLSGDQEYLEQLSQLEKRDKSPDRRSNGSQTRRSRTPSVVSSSSQSSQQGLLNK